MRYFYLYRITNLINNKFYIGIHCSNKIPNTYLGSGVHIRRAINKYGIENFQKEILAFFKNTPSLLNAERFIVNEDFINDPLCMNMKVGGIGGWTKSACKNGALTRIGKKHTFKTKQQISE